MDKIKTFFSVKRNVIIFSVISALLIAAVVVLILVLSNKSTPENANATSDQPVKEEGKVVKFYDNLTGELLSYSGKQYNLDGTEKDNGYGKTVSYTEKEAEYMAKQANESRINCIQIPNGTDAQPQVGLHEAKIIYEAIAEGGITRFAALYRDANSNVIGPVRSLRTYYLDWDTPYDCTIIHAGGEKVALQRVQEYKHLSESATYMWRDYSAYYAPNNLFTSANHLNKFNADKGYDKSNPKTFARITPEESDEELKAIRKAQKEAIEAQKSTENAQNEGEKEAEKPKYTYASNIYVHITASPYYNVNYTYNPSTNTYLRAYEAGGPHLSYTCMGLKAYAGKIKPQKDCGEAKQVAPKVVVVMKVDEQLNQENLYREDIKTTGSGEVYVFQNGVVLAGTWERTKNSDQLKFKDAAGKEIKLAPGQTIITVIAKSYGYVKF